jgi:hypothetical protein
MVVVPTFTPLIAIFLLSTVAVAKSVAAETAVKGEVPLFTVTIDESPTATSTVALSNLSVNSAFSSSSHDVNVNATKANDRHNKLMNFVDFFILIYN